MDHQENSCPVTIRLYSQRSILYKIGFLAIYISFPLYMYSFSSPNWIHLIEKDGDEFSVGLWSSLADQKGPPPGNALTVIRVMACVCVVGYLSAIVTSLYDNCRLVSPDYHSRKVEWFALTTATIGLLMDLLYVFLYFVRLWDATIKLGYLINFSAITILFVAVTLIACKNRNPAVGRGTVISRPPMIVQYVPGQPQASVTPGQACFTDATLQNKPFLQPYPPPVGPPPPYSYPPSYPTDGLKT